MNATHRTSTPQSSLALRGSIVDDEGETLSASQIGQACRVSMQQLEVWVFEGVLQPSGGATAGEWRFGGTALRRIRVAERLQRELELTPPAVAVALDLLDRIAALEARLRRAGLGEGR